jgi:hypothetical protein
MKTKYQDLPRKTKKAIKRNFMKTIDSNWKSKEVKIKELRRSRYGEKADYKRWIVCGYELT